MAQEKLSVRERLAAATNTLAKDWEQLYGSDSGVGIDYWYRHRQTRAEAYANIHQGHLRIAVEGERVYDGPHTVSE